MNFIIRHQGEMLPYTQKYIDSSVVPDIIPNRYLISNYGYIYDTKKEMYISFSYNKAGYVLVNLMTLNGQKKFILHRLVMMAFNPIDNSKDMEVDHIYMTKNNNYIGDLEWVTPDENKLRAIQNGSSAILPGENNAGAILNDDDVRFICRLLESGRPISEFENEVANFIYPKNLKTLHEQILRIALGERWSHISKDYNIIKEKYISNRISYTDEEVSKIVDMLKSNHQSEEIISSLGYDINSLTKNEIDNHKAKIINIKNKFNINNSEMSISRSNFDVEDVVTICEMLQDKYTITYIVNELFNKDNSLSKRQIFNLRCAVQRIKSRVSFKNISKDYEW